MSFFNSWFSPQPDLGAEIVQSESRKLAAQQKLRAAEDALAQYQTEVAERLRDIGGTERDITREERETIEDLYADVERAQKELSLYQANVARLQKTKTSVEMVEDTRRTLDVTSKVAATRLGNKEEIEALSEKANEVDDTTSQVQESLDRIVIGTKTGNRSVAGRRLLGPAASLLAPPAAARNTQQAARVPSSTSAPRTPAPAARRPEAPYPANG